MERTTFDDRTRFPDDEHGKELEEEAKRILDDGELSKSLKELHSKVITKTADDKIETSKLDGRGVNIAFIDQGFDKNMSEFGGVCKGRFKRHMTCIKNEDGTYEIVERTNDRDYEDNFHGNTAADLAAGEKCGIAPNANIYFFEINSNSEDKDYDERVKSILEYIKSNQEDLKLDVISHSAGASKEVLKIADDIRDNYGCEYINSGVFWENYFPGREISGETYEAGFVESARAVPGIYENKNGQFLANKEAMAIPVEGRTSIQVIKDKNGNVEESRKFNGAICGASYAIPQLVGWFVLARQMNPKISLKDFIAKTKELQHTNSKGKIYTNPREVIEKMYEERNLEEAYDKLNSTDIQKTKCLVNISKGLFKEDDLIKVFSGANDIYFNIDRESIISITKNVLDKFNKNNYADNRDFNYMIDLLSKIQSEVTKFFGTKKENRMAYYYNNGRIPSDNEDIRICSMSQIKGKGVAKCAEKASCVNNILKLLHEIDVFPYDVSYLNLLTQIGDNSPGGHAILEFPRTNKDGEIIHFLYDITNPERVEYLGEKYAYPAIYSLNDKEYKDFIEHGTPFNNKSKFIMRDWYKPTEDRAYLGFQENNKALLDHYVYDILSRIDKSLSKKDIVKFVHIELGKVLMYDNSYTEKYTKDDNAEMTQMSKERREKLLADATSLDTAEQICKGMAEISAAIFNKLGIDAKVVGAEEKGEVDGEINEKTNETIVVPKIYTSKFIGSRIVTGENQQTKQTDAKAKHYYTIIDIDEEEPIIQDYVMEKALTRIKIGESTMQDENIPGLCIKSEYNDRVSHEMTVHEDFKQRIESELIAQYGENSSYDDRFKFIFETLQKQEKNLGTDEAINYARFMSETLIGIDNIKEMNKSGKFKFVNLVKETNDHSDLVCIYSLNGQNYFVRGNNERFRKTTSNWRNIRTAN